MTRMSLHRCVATLAMVFLLVAAVDETVGDEVHEMTLDVELLVELSDFDTPQIVQLIRTTIAPDTWNTNGKPGKIEIRDGGKKIFVRHTGDTLNRVDDLISRLNRIAPDYDRRYGEKLVIEMVGEMAELLKTVQDAQLTVHRLDGEAKAPKGGKRVHGWTVLETKPIEDDNLRAQIVEVLCERSTYSIDQEGALCFMPGLAFEWKANDATVEMLICLKCNWIRIYRDGKHTDSHVISDEGNAALLQVYEDLFSAQER